MGLGRHFCEILVFSRRLLERRRMDGCRDLTWPFCEEEMMNVTNQNQDVSWNDRLGWAMQPRRFSVGLTVSGFVLLGIVLTSSQVAPASVKKSEGVESVAVHLATALPIEADDLPSQSRNSQPQALALNASHEIDFKVVHEMARDGLDFALAGAEISNSFGPYKPIGKAVSWFAQALSQPQKNPQLADLPTRDTHLAVHSQGASPEKEKADWLLQNLAWGR